MHHPTAIIDSKAKLDKDVKVGPYCVIGPNVKVGSGTVLESHVILKGNTRIGKKNHIFQFSTVGDSTPDKKYKGCLLYTSPSPRDGLLSRMPSSA